MLRYTFAVDFIRETRDIKLLQEAMGHREASATQIYTRLLFKKNTQTTDDLIVKRSGIPALEEHQVQINYDNGCSYAGSETASKVKEAVEQVIVVAAERIKDNAEAINKTTAVAKPSIILDTASSSEPKIRIPAIKCSSCSFILHYQGNCPQCGASFNDILKHWGKTF